MKIMHCLNKLNKHAGLRQGRPNSILAGKVQKRLGADCKAGNIQEVECGRGSPFTLRTYPILDLDELSTDDTLEKALGGVNEGEVSIEPLRISQTASGVEFSFAPGTSGELSIYDASGRRVFSRSITSNTTELHWSTSTVPSGLYFARLKTPSKAITERLAIIH